jgi:hypothetical protein
MTHPRARIAGLALAIALLGLGVSACTGSDNGGVITPPAGVTTTNVAPATTSTTAPGFTSTTSGTLPAS